MPVGDKTELVVGVPAVDHARDRGSRDFHLGTAFDLAPHRAGSVEDQQHVFAALGGARRGEKDEGKGKTHGELPDRDVGLPTACRCSDSHLPGL
jgi:hypothetical protein